MGLQEGVDIAAILIVAVSLHYADDFDLVFEIS